MATKKRRAMGGRKGWQRVAGRPQSCRLFLEFLEQRTLLSAGYGQIDVAFLSDTTGSMGGAISAVRTNATALLNRINTGLSSRSLEYAAAAYRDFDGPGYSPYPYEFALFSDMNPDIAGAQAGINQWSAQAGGDWPECELYALTHCATDIDWRRRALHVVVWFGDAPGHDPSGGATEASTIAALQDAGIHVIAVNVGYMGMNEYGQCTRIVDATDGRYYTSSTANLVETMYQAIVELAGDVGKPVISGIHAQYDGDARGDVVGKFIEGVSVENRIDVVATEMGAGDWLEFSSGGSVIASDHDASDGWGTVLDMGDFSGETAVTVTAYSTDPDNPEVPIASEPYDFTLDVIPTPDWLQPAADREVSIEWNAWLKKYDVSCMFDAISAISTTPSDWCYGLLGGKDNGFRVGTALSFDYNIYGEAQNALTAVYYKTYLMDIEVPGLSSTLYVPNFTTGTISLSDLASLRSDPYGHIADKIGEEFDLWESDDPWWKPEVTGSITVNPLDVNDDLELIAGSTHVEFGLAFENVLSIPLGTIYFPVGPLGPLFYFSGSLEAGAAPTLNLEIDAGYNVSKHDWTWECQVDVGVECSLTGTVKANVILGLGAVGGELKGTLFPHLEFKAGSEESTSGSVVVDASVKGAFFVEAGWGLVREDLWNLTLWELSPPYEFPLFGSSGVGATGLASATAASVGGGATGDASEAEEPPFNVLADPQVASTTSGSSLIVFKTDPGVTDASSLEFATRSASGVVSESQSLATEATWKASPALDLGSDGTGFVFWSEAATPAADTTDFTVAERADDMDLRLATWDGTSFSTPTWLTQDETTKYSDGSPAVDVLNASSAAVVWVRGQTDADLSGAGMDIWYGVFDGRQWSEPAALVTDATNDSQPDVAVNKDRRCVAVWVKDGDGDPTTTSLWWSWYDPKGKTWSTPAELVAEAAGRSVSTPRLLAMDDGSIVAVWEQVEGDAITLRESVWKYRSKGSMWSEPAVLVQNSGAVADLDLVAGPNQTVFALYSQEAGGREIAAIGRCYASGGGVTQAFTLQSETGETFLQPSGAVVSGSQLVLGSSSFDSLGSELALDAVTLQPDLRPTVAVRGGLRGLTGEKTTLDVTIVNEGFASSTASTVNIMLGDTVLRKVKVKALKPGQSVVVSAPWVRTQGSGEIRATVDPNGSLAEMEEGDNLATASFLSTESPVWTSSTEAGLFLQALANSDAGETVDVLLNGEVIAAGVALSQAGTEIPLTLSPGENLLDVQGVTDAGKPGIAFAARLDGVLLGDRFSDGLLGAGEDMAFDVFVAGESTEAALTAGAKGTTFTIWDGDDGSATVRVTGAPVTVAFGDLDGDGEAEVASLGLPDATSRTSIAEVASDGTGVAIGAINATQLRSVTLPHVSLVGAGLAVDQGSVDKIVFGDLGPGSAIEVPGNVKSLVFQDAPEGVLIDVGGSLGSLAGRSFGGTIAVGSSGSGKAGKILISDGSLVGTVSIAGTGKASKVLTELKVLGGSFAGLLDVHGSAGAVVIESPAPTEDEPDVGLLGTVDVTGGLASLTLSQGALLADVGVGGKLGSLSLLNGATLFGSVTAGSIGKVKGFARLDEGAFTGGGFEHGSSLIAQTQIDSIQLQDASMDGYVEVQNGKIGSVTVYNGTLGGTLIAGTSIGGIASKLKTGATTGGDITAAVSAATTIGSVAADHDITEAIFRAGTGLGAVRAKGAVVDSVFSAGFDPGSDGLLGTSDDVVAVAGAKIREIRADGAGGIGARIQATGDIAAVRSGGSITSGTLNAMRFILAGGNIGAIEAVGNIGTSAGAAGHTAPASGVSSIVAGTVTNKGSIGKIRIVSPKSDVDGKLLADVFCQSLGSLETEGLQAAGSDLYDMVAQKAVVPRSAKYDTDKDSV